MAPHNIEEYLVEQLVKDSSETAKRYLKKLSRAQLIQLFENLIEREEAELKIPVSILRNRKVSCLEAIIKFLRENVGMKNAAVADVLKRSPQVCWRTYSNAKKKLEDRLETEDGIDIPLSVVRDEKLSVLESIVVYLREQEMNFHEIAVALDRDDRTIWTVYHRAKKKNEAS